MYRYEYKVNTSKFAIIEIDDEDEVLDKVDNYIDNHGVRTFYMYSEKSNNEQNFFRAISDVLEAESTALAAASRTATGIFWKFSEFWRYYDG